MEDRSVTDSAAEQNAPAAKKPIHDYLLERIERLLMNFDIQAGNPLNLPNLAIEPSIEFIAGLICENVRTLTAADIPDDRKTAVAAKLQEMINETEAVDLGGASDFCWGLIRDAFAEVIATLSVPVPSS